MSYYNRQSITDQFIELQADRKCGMRQNNGRLCTNPWVESVPIDPDKPDGDRIGACGMHMKDMMSDLARVQKNKWNRHLEDFLDYENRRLIRALHSVGIMVKPTGYGRHNKELVVENPSALVERLHDLGAISDFNMRYMCKEGPHVAECGPPDREARDGDWCACGCEIPPLYQMDMKGLKNCWDPPPEEVKDADQEGSDQGTKLGA